jgi:hypothetical protein
MGSLTEIGKYQMQEISMQAQLFIHMNELYAKAIPVVAQYMGFGPSVRLTVCRACHAFPRRNYFVEVNEQTLGFYKDLGNFPLYQVLRKCLRYQPTWNRKVYHIQPLDLYNALDKEFTMAQRLFAAFQHNDGELANQLEKSIDGVYDFGCLALAQGKAAEWVEFGRKHCDANADFVISVRLGAMWHNNIEMLKLLPERPTFITYVRQVCQEHSAYSAEFAALLDKSDKYEGFFIVPRELLKQMMTHVVDNPCCSRDLGFIIANAMHYQDYELLDELAHLQPLPHKMALDRLNPAVLQWLAQHPVFGKQVHGCAHKPHWPPWQCRVLENALSSEDYSLAKQMLDLGFSCRLWTLDHYLASFPELGVIIDRQIPSANTCAAALFCKHPDSLHWAWRYCPPTGIKLSRVVGALLERCGNRDADAMGLLERFMQLGYDYKASEVPAALAFLDKSTQKQWLAFLMRNRSWTGFLKAALQHKNTQRLAQYALRMGCPIDRSACHRHNWFHYKYCGSIRTPFPSRRYCPHHGSACVHRLNKD